MQRVVLVDDEALDLEGLKRFIPWRELGMEVSGTFTNSVKALEYMMQNHVDVLVTDIKMPRMSGLELAEQIKESLPRLRVVFMSGYADFHYAKKAIHLHADGYVLKPVDDQEVIGILHTVRRELIESGFKAISNPISSKTTKNRRLIEEIEKFIDTNIENKLTLRDTARHFAFSPNHLGFIFKDATGQNFTEYLIRKRLERAEKLLKDPREKIYTVANKLGYHNITYFSRQFKEYFGVSPSEYRK